MVVVYHLRAAFSILKQLALIALLRPLTDINIYPHIAKLFQIVLLRILYYNKNRQKLKNEETYPIEHNPRNPVKGRVKGFCFQSCSMKEVISLWAYCTGVNGVPGKTTIIDALIKNIIHVVALTKQIRQETCNKSFYMIHI